MKKLQVFVLFILCVKYSFASNSIMSTATDFNLDVAEEVYSQECLNSLTVCFDKNYHSNLNDQIVGAIILYLSNFDTLSKHYPYGLLLKRINELSTEVTGDLFQVEAIIYLNGTHVPADFDKAIHIMESNPSFNERDPDDLILLGVAYWMKFSTTGKNDVVSYKQAKQLLLRAYEFGEQYSTKYLAFVLLATENVEDVKLAGKVLKYLAFYSAATEDDKKRYQMYLNINKDVKQK